MNQSGTADYNSSIAPSNVGSYTAQLRFDTDKTASVNFTIVSADSTVTKAPGCENIDFYWFRAGVGNRWFCIWR